MQIFEPPEFAHQIQGESPQRRALLRDAKGVLALGKNHASREDACCRQQQQHQRKARGSRWHEKGEGGRREPLASA